MTTLAEVMRKLEELPTGYQLRILREKHENETGNIVWMLTAYLSEQPPEDGWPDGPEQYRQDDRRLSAWANNIGEEDVFAMGIMRMIEYRIDWLVKP